MPAKYTYLPGDTKHPYELKQCPTCLITTLIQKRRTYCSHRCSKMGDLNPSKQKATNHGLSPVEYATVHNRVRAARGSAFGCSHCLTTEDRVYHWANVSGNYDDVSDYINLCVPCHDRFDRNKSKALSV